MQKGRIYPTSTALGYMNEIAPTLFRQTEREGSKKKEGNEGFVWMRRGKWKVEGGKWRKINTFDATRGREGGKVREKGKKSGGIEVKE
jgi:hypothetical protein